MKLKIDAKQLSKEKRRDSKQETETARASPTVLISDNKVYKEILDNKSLTTDVEKKTTQEQPKIKDKQLSKEKSINDKQEIETANASQIVSTSKHIVNKSIPDIKSLSTDTGKKIIQNKPIMTDKQLSKEKVTDSRLEIENPNPSQVVLTSIDNNVNKEILGSKSLLIDAENKSKQEKPKMKDKQLSKEKSKDSKHDIEIAKPSQTLLTSKNNKAEQEILGNNEPKVIEKQLKESNRKVKSKSDVNIIRNSVTYSIKRNKAKQVVSTSNVIKQSSFPVMGRQLESQLWHQGELSVLIL